MRDINKLNTQVQIEKSWAMNNSIYHETSKEPQSTLEATKPLIQILDAIHKKVNLRDIVKNNSTHLSAPDQSMLLELL